ncbi:MAG: T9SS type A sorting domain-containing protein [Chitinophagales bacterium]|nr:T9SS type A sorting domain-containing protein [Chitinophagales bacterium]
MKNLLPVIIVLYANSLVAQTTWGDSLTIGITATVEPSPEKITLHWIYDADAEDYMVYRKLKTETNWTTLDTIAWYSLMYADTAVNINTAYDYKIKMNAASTPDKYGYVSSGIKVEPTSNRGIVIVVTENSYITDPGFMTAYDQFIFDMEMDGWRVKEIFVSAADIVSDVKDLITEKYNEDIENTISLVLLGHVPVPYSGNINPDGHPDHLGAWPTDTYYADMDGTWTDATVNNATSSNSKNHNIPGDEKFDQSYIPSDVELQTGRIDFYDLPAFAKTEKELLIAYLQKDHAFKTKQIIVNDKAIIDDNFLGYTEGFSQNGFRNFAPLVGNENIFMNDYFTEPSYFTGSGETYLWSYGCGGGWYQGAGGVGDTYSFSIDSLSTVFTMLFGSYFGDWDNSDAFLRAALAQGNTLTNCWAGRPNWHFYHMAMGEVIGYSAQLTQNNSTLYFGSTIPGLTRMVSINLLGDPSLRMHYVALPSNLHFLFPLEGADNFSVNWTASSDDVIGYNIYRKNVDSVWYEKRNEYPVTGTDFPDSFSENGTFIYIVKAVELKTTPSGSYYNESLGITDTIDLVSPVHEMIAGVINIYPNPVADDLHIACAGINEQIIYTISDVNGKTILEGLTSGNNFIIDVEDLPGGIYLLKMQMNSNSVTRKFVKI